MKNATYLTEKYLGLESPLWTPCIHAFFCQHKPLLPVSQCIESPPAQGPWYESRKQSAVLKIEGEILKEPSARDLLPKIGSIFGRNLMGDPGRVTSIGDITGIDPDFILIRPDKEGVCLIENKPYYSSDFTGNQGPGGAYIRFVQWMNRGDIPCEYLLVFPISWKKYPEVKKIQDALQDRFGVLLLEDIFLAMHTNKFKFAPIQEDWSEYTDKGSDYA